MSIKVGEVIAVQGVKITLRIFEESNKDTLFYDGEKYKGVSIREYIYVRRGFKSIVCIIEGEYLDENRYVEDKNKKYYIRKVEAKPIGYFENEIFNEGIKYLPMIKDSAYLLKEDKISEMYSKDKKEGLVIGKMLKEEIPVSLPWHKLFNSHIGIFGNTGSGKSNTLAKLYTALFDKKLQSINGTSNFVVIDFNGEYTSGQLVDNNYKTVLNLNTQSDDGDKFKLSENEFWNTESLSILFQATANTQKPFLNRVINGRKRFSDNPDSLLNYIKKSFSASFKAASPKADTLDLLRNIATIINHQNIVDLLSEISWHAKQNKFFRSRDSVYFESDGVQYDNVLEHEVNNITIDDIDDFKELLIRANLQLIRDLINGYVQFDFIQPLLKRVESSLSSLCKVVVVDSNEIDRKLVTVISLRKCNQDIKKVLPLLIAKHYYNQHKDSIDYPPDRTMHLIIDEAHNILSQQSTRENENWRDYRLELFEEIIKEGRKFGMYITLSSQRPADISPTIISQIHNFFIHRLINDRDLFLLDNTISTLDSLSRSLIPNLSKGSCIITGTSFDLPMILQIDQLEKTKQPDSEDVDLVALWK